MNRRCATCGGPARVKGAGGIRSCMQASCLKAVAELHPLWVRLPGPGDVQDFPESLDDLVAAGALSPEAAEGIRQEWADLASACGISEAELEALSAEPEIDAAKLLAQGEG